MKKQTLILAAGLTLASLLLSGCGDEAKFNTAKDNFTKYVDELYKDARYSPASYSNTPCAQFHKAYKIQVDLVQKADKELNTIKELAKTNSTYKEKLQNLSSKIQEYNEEKYSVSKVGEYHKKEYGCSIEIVKLEN